MGLRTMSGMGIYTPQEYITLYFYFNKIASRSDPIQ